MKSHIRLGKAQDLWAVTAPKQAAASVCMQAVMRNWKAVSCQEAVPARREAAVPTAAVQSVWIPVPLR